MAGIGFALHRLGDERSSKRQETRRHGGIAVVSPWIFAIIALELLRRGVDAADLGEQALSLRANIIYLFLISLVSAAAVTAVAMRIVFDDVYRERTDQTAATYLLALVGSAAAGAVVALVLFAATTDFSGPQLLAEMAAAGAMAMTWTATAFCTAIRAYRPISFAFMAGFAVSVFTTLFVAQHGGGFHLQAMAFASGLGAASVWLSGNVFRALGEPTAETLKPALTRVVSGSSNYRSIALGAVVAAAAIWVDSIVVWHSTYAKAAPNGLATMPFYDSAMFVARMSMLPALLVFLTFLDGEWFDRLRAYLRAVNHNDTLDQITSQSALFERSIKRGLLWLIGIQSAVALLLYVFLPDLVDPLGLLYEQVGILRVGVLGTVFYALFALTATLVLYCGRDLVFLALHFSFIVLNGVATALFLSWGPDYLGFGFLVASILGAVFAAVALEDALKNLPYITFAKALRNSRMASRRPRAYRSTRFKPWRSRIGLLLSAGR
jgi:uncharacterized membrane protein